MRKVMTGVVVLLLSGSAIAADTPPFSGETNASWLKSTGSSEKETIKGLVAGKYLHHRWTHELKLEALNESDGSTGQRTSERYLAQEKSSWNFTERDFLFYKMQVEKDQQSSWDYQAFAALGYGHIFIKTDTMYLSTELGAGTRHSKDDLTGNTTDEALGNAALKYEWKFRPGARFNEDIALEVGEDNTVLRTRTALTFDLTQVINLSMAYETKRADGPSNIDDTMTSVGLGYRF